MKLFKGSKTLSKKEQINIKGGIIPNLPQCDEGTYPVSFYDPTRGCPPNTYLVGDYMCCSMPNNGGGGNNNGPTNPGVLE